jgi:hypothetical protein
LLVLGGVVASELGWDEIALACRQQVLRHNPRHLVRRWPTLSAALETERFRIYRDQLRRKYSPEKAEHMLDALGIAVDDGPKKGQSAQTRAMWLLDSLSDSASSAAGSRDPGSSRRTAHERRTSAPGATVSGEIAVPAPWWPFWAGLAAWVIVAAVWLVVRA